MVAAVKRNYPQREIADAAYQLQQEIDSGRRLVVGLNSYTEGGLDDTPLLRIDPSSYIAARDQAAANLRVTQAQLDNAKLALETARINYPARLASAQAQLAAADAARVKAEADARRQASLPRQATTQQDIDTANARARR